MSIKLDDLLNEVKPPPQALDLGNTEMKTKQQFLDAFSKVPEYKIRPEKVRPEEVFGEGPNGWKGRSSNANDMNYTNPLPSSMRGLVMDEFYQVDIDWRMLTTARPANKFEEEVFSRYVELGRAQLERIRTEGDNINYEQDKIIKVVPGKGSLPEVRINSCRMCGEELCGGACEDYMYESYARSQPEKKQSQEVASEGDDDNEDNKKKKKKKKRKKKKKKAEGNESGEEADDEKE